MVHIIAFNLFLVGCLVYALRYGGEPEKAAMLSQAVGRHIDHHRHPLPSSSDAFHEFGRGACRHRLGLVARPHPACASCEPALDDFPRGAAALNRGRSPVQGARPGTACGELRRLRSILGLADAHYHGIGSPLPSSEDQEVWRRTRLEAILATLSPGRFHDLIDRIFLWRRPQHAVFDIMRVHYPAVRALAEAAPPDSRDHGPCLVAAARIARLRRGRPASRKHRLRRTDRFDPSIVR